MDLLNLLLFAGLFALAAAASVGTAMWALIDLNDIPDHFPKKVRAHKERRVLLRSIVLATATCVILALAINPVL